MKKWWFLLPVLATVLLFGNAGTDVSRLEPVQIVRLTACGGTICLQTDTGAAGRGEGLAGALENMKDTAASEVFLDTAEYLLIEPELRSILPQMKTVLRPSCRICFFSGEINLEQAGAFLMQHQPQIALKDYLAGKTDVPTLYAGKAGMKLVS